jgi:hypothetical protein
MFTLNQFALLLTSRVWALPAAALTLNQILDLLKVVPVLLGAGWAYFRFVRFRTLKKRVEFSFEWKCSKASDGRLLGILTVKLSNKGNTQIYLRHKDEFRCRLAYSLIRAGKTDKPVVFLNSRSRDLQGLPFIFKDHQLIEPGETIDDVAILSLEASDALAIQFQAYVLSVRRNGKKETQMSSVVAFSTKPDADSSEADSSKATSEDEQDEYDEVDEIRGKLQGWVGEAESVLARGFVAGDSERIQELIRKARDLINRLHAQPSPAEREAAGRCADDLKKLVWPLI